MTGNAQVLARPRRSNLNFRKLNSLVVYGGNTFMALLFLARWIWALAISLVPAVLLFKYTPVLFHWPLSFESFKFIVEFDDGRFISDMRLSALIAASTSVCVLVISGLAGYAFARLNFWGKNFLFVLILATMMFPFTAVLMPLFSLISALKLMNNPVTLLLLYTTFHLPFCIFLFRNSFEAIPGALRDAALIDGCHEFGVLTQVMIPLVKPAIATVLIYVVYTSWNEFVSALIFLNGDHTTVPVVLAQMANGHRFASQPNVLMAGSVLAFLPILVLFLFFQRFFVQGLTTGSTR
jgi:ABC-type glycerol-3-phosphate transport system permease component